MSQVSRLRQAGCRWVPQLKKRPKVSHLPTNSLTCSNSHLLPGEEFNNWNNTPSAQSLSSEHFKHLHEEGLVDTLFSTALNPVACLFHLAFKGLTVFCFLFLNAMIHEEILTFIIVVTLAAADFWTVKNVTGRLLVNMRWDSHIDQWGNEIWVYESDESRKH